MKTFMTWTGLLFAMVWWGCPAAPEASEKIAETPPVSEMTECTGLGTLGGACTHRCAAVCGGCACQGHFLGCVCRCTDCDEAVTVAIAPDDQLDAVRRILEESTSGKAPDLIGMLDEIRRRAAADDPGVAETLAAFDQALPLLDAETMERFMALAQK